MRTPTERKSVLLVDDSPEFLSTTSGLFSELSGGTWEIATHSSGGHALASLQKAPADLIALDVNMPVLDGVQLLGLLQRRFPSVLKVVLTGEASSEQRAACLKAGAELVLDKPTEAEGWRNAYAALDSLLQAPREDGFRGVLRKVSLPDIIQMECLAANSSILEVTGAGMRGRLYIKDGQLVHGEIGELTGVEALNTVLCLPGGSFHLLPFTDPGRETISGQWEFLLMEAARVRDESADARTRQAPSFDPETLPDAAAIEAFSIQPHTASTTPSQASEAPSLPTTTPLATSSQPAATSPVPGSSPETKPAETTTGMRPMIQETLICSLDGEVLYDWNCPKSVERVSLLEFITKRASKMTASVPLGSFERFESVDRGTRCVAKLDGKEALFVRVQSVLTGGPGAADTE